jgi:hypothetical protein
MSIDLENYFCHPNGYSRALRLSHFIVADFIKMRNFKKCRPLLK